jgi:hypothetical protein
MKITLTLRLALFPVVFASILLWISPGILFAQFSLSKGTETVRDFNKCTVCGGDLHKIGQPGGCRCTSDTDCQSAMNALLAEMGDSDHVGGYSRKDLDKLQRTNCEYLKTVAKIWAHWRDKDERRRDADDAAASQIKTANDALKKAFHDDDPNSLSYDQRQRLLGTADAEKLGDNAEGLRKQARALQDQASKAFLSRDYQTSSALETRARTLNYRASELENLSSSAKSKQRQDKWDADTKIEQDKLKNRLNESTNENLGRNGEGALESVFGQATGEVQNRLYRGAGKYLSEEVADVLDGVRTDVPGVESVKIANDNVEQVKTIVDPVVKLILKNGDTAVGLINHTNAQVPRHRNSDNPVPTVYPRSPQTLPPDYFHSPTPTATPSPTRLPRDYAPDDSAPKPTPWYRQPWPRVPAPQATPAPAPKPPEKPPRDLFQ